MGELCLEDLSAACSWKDEDEHKIKQCLTNPNLVSVPGNGPTLTCGKILVQCVNTSRSNVNIVKLLLSDSRFIQDVECLDQALYFAICHDNLEIVKLLVEVGKASINGSSDDNYNRPLKAVIHFCHLDILKYFITQSQQRLIVSVYDVYGLITGYLPKQDKNSVFKQLLTAYPIDFNINQDYEIEQYKMFLIPTCFFPLKLRYYCYDNFRKEYYHDVETIIKQYTPLQEYRNDKQQTLDRWKMEL